MTYCLKGAQEGKSVVVIGSSFISMELVVAVSKRKLASLDVIGMEHYPFENVLGKEVGAGLMKVIYCIYRTTLVLIMPSTTNLKVLNSTCRARSKGLFHVKIIRTWLVALWSTVIRYLQIWS